MIGRLLCMTGALVLLGFHRQAYTYGDDLGDLEITYGGGGMSGTNTEHPTFSLAGNPVVIKKNSQGVWIYSRKISGTLDQDPAGLATLRSADGVGDFRIVMDSNVAAAYAKKHQLAAPIGEYLSQLTSTQASIRSSGERYVITFPEAFHLVDYHSSATKTAARRKDESDATGDKGTFTVMPKATAQQGKPLNYDVQTGSIVGNVHYHLIETVTPLGGGLPETTNYDVQSDRLDVDFTKPEGTIVLSGNVRWNRKSKQSVHGTCDKFTVTTNQNHEMTGWTSEGATPPETVFETPGGKP
ncbi:MAG TPA: hypothetical protein VG944_04800 [Fimbriimonas sp.]|nr:hypothetical protein [Fimbriimonas sp.]